MEDLLERQSSVTVVLGKVIFIILAIYYANSSVNYT